MFSKEEQQQYNRHLILPEIGKVGQTKLKNTKVLVIGAGGLGCPVLQYLTAAGIGHIGVVDADVVSQSNLQRQILFSVDDIGKLKVEVSKSKLSRLNPYIHISVYPTYLTTENALDLIADFDIIVDASDNFPTRYLVNDACVIANKPLVYGAIFKFDGQVSVFNYNESGTYRCLFPTPPKVGEMPNCSEIGVLGVLPGIIGCLQANEVIKMICNLQGVLSGKLLTFDSLTMQQNVFSYVKTDESKRTKLESDYNFFCGIPIQDEISLEELQSSKENYDLLDVRTKSERETYDIGGKHIPLSELANRYQELDFSKNLVVYCKSGKRSANAIEFLKTVTLTRLLNLSGGIG